MSDPKNHPKDDIIAEFEAMLRGDETQNKKLEKNPTDLTQWLRPFVKRKLGVGCDESVGAVNVGFDHAPDGLTGTLKVLVFSGVALPSLPTYFWVKNSSGPFLCKTVDSTKWSESVVRILSQGEPPTEITSVPYFYIEKKVSIVPVDTSKKQIEFENAVMEIGNYKPHLKLTLSENVYNTSRQEEFKSLRGLTKPEMLTAVIKEQHRAKMKEWEAKIKKRTSRQLACTEDFIVSEADLSEVLLSQDQVNELLGHALKKTS